jgi:hypothetical protein
MSLLGNLNVDPSGMEEIQTEVGPVMAPVMGYNQGGIENLRVPLKHGPVGMVEYVPQVQAGLEEFFKAGYENYFNGQEGSCINFINKTLVDHQALVSGGFILKCAGLFPDPTSSKDIDMYVPCKHLKSFNIIMAKLFEAKEVIQHNATFYCLSFLRKNGIRSVQKFYDVKARKHYDAKEMDIMAVRNARSPLEVVQNFDLTFCQIWYDGKMVSATHPQDVKNKTGILQKEYVLSYIEGNRFIRGRLQKYKWRGFNIQLESGPLVLPNHYQQNKCLKTPPTDENSKRWISRAIFHYIATGKYQLTDNGIYKNKNVAMNLGGVAGIGLKLSRPFYEIRKRIDFSPAPGDLATTTIDKTDGYDSEDFDIENPISYTDLIDDRPLPPANIHTSQQTMNTWNTFDVTTKFWHWVREFMNNVYSTHQDKTIFPILKHRNTIAEDVYHMIGMVYYVQQAEEKTVRMAMDPVSLENERVYDLHFHTLDKATSRESLEGYLEPLITVQDKTTLPCYLSSEGCTHTLTLDEIRAIVSKDFYLRFAAPILGPPARILGTTVLVEGPPEQTLDLIDVLRNTPSDAGSWKNIYHHIMCPFCLEYISRDAGCTYVFHDNTKGLPYRKMPYCKDENRVKEMFDKYTPYMNADLEICAECGRPCTNHTHFDLNDPPGLEQPRLTATGAPDYAKCSGGGRREGIARIIGVRRTLEANPGMEAKEIRKLCALAAEDAASDAALLNEADAILAKAPANRAETNIHDPAAAAAPANQAGGKKYKLTRKRSSNPQRKTKKN